MIDRSRVLVFIPMYNCERQITRVLDQLRDPVVQRHVDGVVCVDNRSTDRTVAAATEGLASLTLPMRALLQNDDNYGLGGSHKVAIDFGRKHGYDFLIVLHGDDQGSINDIVVFLAKKDHLSLDFLMGARFMKGSHLQGYSILRTYANKAFNVLFSVISWRRLYDLGSGLNLFRLSAFDSRFHQKFADDLTFNYYLILAVAAGNFNLTFFPLSWREEDQVSNAKLTKMGVQILKLLRWRVTDSKAFFVGEHRDVKRNSYPSTLLQCWRELAEGED